MRLVALVPNSDHVCARYRLAAFAPFLAEQGHQLDLVPWSSRWFVSASILQAVRQADVVIVQRRLLPWWQLRLLRNLSRRLIFDFDDAIFLRDSYAAKVLPSVRRLNGFRRMVQAADAVSAGNSFLAERAREWAAPERVWVIPTCVPAARYPLARHERKSRTVLVWIGSSSTLQGLERIAGMLDRLGESMPGLRLRIICDRPLALSTLLVEHRPWSAESERNELATSDIGISWLPDDDWSRGKCGLKVLQYQAAGLAVVANPVGMQTDLVRDGVTGFLAQTVADWRDALHQLTTDADLRRRLGQAGRRRVEQEFDVARGAALWLELLNALPIAKPSRASQAAMPAMKTWSSRASAGAS